MVTTAWGSPALMASVHRVMLVLLWCHCGSVEAGSGRKLLSSLISHFLLLIHTETTRLTSDTQERSRKEVKKKKLFQKLTISSRKLILTVDRPGPKARRGGGGRSRKTFRNLVFRRRLGDGWSLGRTCPSWFVYSTLRPPQSHDHKPWVMYVTLVSWRRAA